MIKFDFKKMEFIESEKASQCSFLQFLKNVTIEPSCDENKNSNLSLLNKLAAIGYLMVSNKDMRCPRAIIVYGPPRSGKSLFAGLFDKVSNCVNIDGRSIMNNRFIWNAITDKTKIVQIEDFPQNADSLFEQLYCCLTGTWVVEQKGRCSYALDFKNSPKVLITTQSNIVLPDVSFSARAWHVRFSDFYNSEWKPIDDFNEMLFMEWNTEQWSMFWELLADCINIFVQNRAEIERLKLYSFDLRHESK